MHGLIGNNLEVLGCVVTKWQDVASHRDAINQLVLNSLNPNGIRLFDIRIPYDANVIKDESNVFRIPGLGKKPAALRYTELTEEVVKYVDNA